MFRKQKFKYLKEYRFLKSKKKKKAYKTIKVFLMRHKHSGKPAAYYYTYVA